MKKDIADFFAVRTYQPKKQEGEEPICLHQMAGVPFSTQSLREVAEKVRRSYKLLASGGYGYPIRAFGAGAVATGGGVLARCYFTPIGTRREKWCHILRFRTKEVR